MKILLVGDYSNCHVALAAGLRSLGHHVVVASDGSKWMNTERTISLKRRLPGKAGGALLYLELLASRQLRGFDIVALTNPTFVSLRPERIKNIFNRLKQQNGKVYLTAAGSEKAFIDMLTASDCPLRYSEHFNPDGSPNIRNAHRLETVDKLWQQGQVGELCEYVYDQVDGVQTVLYEYHLAMQRRLPTDKLAYVGIPIDLEAIEPLQRPLAENDKVNIFLGRKREYLAFKGTDRLGVAAQRVAQEFPNRCSLSIVENLPYNEYIKALNSGDLVLDQIYSYTPATNALLAMAKGQAVVSGAEPEYYDFIGERDLRPVFNAEPDDDKLYELLSLLVSNPQLIRQAGAQGREFVARHNAANVVAQRCLDFWTK